MRNKLLYTKFIGFLSGLLLLFFVFIPIARAQSQTQNINLNGLWKSSFGSTVTIDQTGTVIKGTIKESKTSSRVGTTDMTGSFDGDKIKGEVYLRANNRSCSFLDGYFPATGTVSPDGNIITFTWENHIYNDDTCKFTGEIRQGTLTYVRIISQNSPTPILTAIPVVTLQPTVSLRAGGNSNIGKEIPGYTQALVVDPPKASDFPKVPRSDFVKVYPIATASAVSNPATPSANIKDNIFIGKVGGEGEIVIDLPNGGTTVLKDDRSYYDGGVSGISWRFGDSVFQPPSAYYVKIYETDCHLLLAKNNRSEPTKEGEPYRERYADIWDAQTRIDRIVGDCTYLNEGGPVRVLAEQGQVIFKTPGDVTVTANKADFGIGYSAKSGASIVEIYNGLVTVENKSGQSKTISTVYGSKINRIEVDKGGTMTEKTAIPQSEWKAFLASNQKKEQEVNTKSSSPIVPAIAVLGMGGLIFFLYRTGRLLLLYKISIQKISELMGKNRKGEKKE